VVNAYNTLPTATLANEAHRSELYALFYCGDNREAKAIVSQLITDSGFAAVDTDNLNQVIHQEPAVCCITIRCLKPMLEECYRLCAIISLI